MRSLDSSDGAQHCEELLRGIAHQLGAALDFEARLLDERLDVGRGLRRALRETTHFDGDHRKALASFAGARRFDGSVEGEEIGLEGDVVDEADDVADLGRRRGDALHRFVGAVHDLAAFRRGIADAHGPWRSPLPCASSCPRRCRRADAWRPRFPRSSPTAWRSGRKDRWRPQAVRWSPS